MDTYILNGITNTCQPIHSHTRAHVCMHTPQILALQQVIKAHEMESDSRARLDLDRSSLAVKLNGLSTITSHPSAEECGTMHHSHTFPSYMLSTSMPVFPLFTLIISLSHHVNQKIAVGKVNATYLYLDFSEILSRLVLFPFAQL